MNRLKVLTDNDPVLKKKAVSIPVIDGSIKKLASDMIYTMQAENGVGLAAPQVGKSIRLIVIQMPGEDPFAIINTRIIKSEGEREVVEGCLSVRGYEGVVKRSVSVVTKGLDCDGKQLRIKAGGLLAQAIEHELDHLEGVLFTDRIEDSNKLYRIENTYSGDTR